MGLVGPKGAGLFHAKIRWLVSKYVRMQKRRATIVELQGLLAYIELLWDAHMGWKTGGKWRSQLATMSRKHRNLQSTPQRKIRRSSVQRLKDKLVRKKMGTLAGTVPFFLSKAIPAERRRPSPEVTGPAPVPRGTLPYPDTKRDPRYRGNRKRSAARRKMLAEARRQTRFFTLFGHVKVAVTAGVSATPEATGSTGPRPAYKMKQTDKKGKKVTSTAGPKRMLVGVAQIARKAVKKKAVKLVFTAPAPTVEDAHAVENAEPEMLVSASTATSGEDAQKQQSTPTASSSDALAVLSGDASDSASIGGASTVYGAEYTSSVFGSEFGSDIIVVPDVNQCDENVSQGPIAAAVEERVHIVEDLSQGTGEAMAAQEEHAVYSVESFSQLPVEIGPTPLMVEELVSEDRMAVEEGRFGKEDGIEEENIFANASVDVMYSQPAIEYSAPLSDAQEAVMVQDAYSKQQDFSIPVEHTFNLAQPTVSVSDIDLAAGFEVAVNEDVELVDADDGNVSVAEDTFEDLTMLMEANGDRPDAMEEYVEVTSREEEETTPRQEEGSVADFATTTVEVDQDERGRQLQDEAEALLASIMGDLTDPLDSTVVHTAGTAADIQTVAEDELLSLQDANQFGLESSNEKGEGRDVVAESAVTQEVIGDEDVDTTLVDLIGEPRKDKGKQRELPSIPLCTPSASAPDDDLVPDSPALSLVVQPPMLPSPPHSPMQHLNTAPPQEPMGNDMTAEGRLSRGRLRPRRMQAADTFDDGVAPLQGSSSGPQRTKRSGHHHGPRPYVRSTDSIHSWLRGTLAATNDGGSSLPAADDVFTMMRESDSAQEKREARERRRAERKKLKQQQQEQKANNEPRKTGVKIRLNRNAETGKTNLTVIQPDDSAMDELSNLMAGSITLTAHPPANDDMDDLVAMMAGSTTLTAALPQDDEMNDLATTAVSDLSIPDVVVDTEHEAEELGLLPTPTPAAVENELALDDLQDLLAKMEQL